MFLKIQAYLFFIQITKSNKVGTEVILSHRFGTTLAQLKTIEFTGLSAIWHMSQRLPKVILDLRQLNHVLQHNSKGQKGVTKGGGIEVHYSPPC